MEVSKYQIFFSYRILADRFLSLQISIVVAPWSKRFHMPLNTPIWSTLCNSAGDMTSAGRYPRKIFIARQVQLFCTSAMKMKIEN